MKRDARRPRPPQPRPAARRPGTSERLAAGDVIVCLDCGKSLVSLDAWCPCFGPLS